MTGSIRLIDRLNDNPLLIIMTFSDVLYCTVLYFSPVVCLHQKES